jgi:hypothetical protein
MIQPKKCALCHCVDEKGRATCEFCGEATWQMIWVKGSAPPLETELVLEPVAEPAKPRRSSKR